MISETGMADTLTSTCVALTETDQGTHKEPELSTMTPVQGKNDCSSLTEIELARIVKEEDKEDPSLLFELEPKNISNDFSLSLQSGKTPDNNKTVTDSTPSSSVKVLPSKTSSSSSLINVLAAPVTPNMSAAPATPNIHSTKTIKARKLLYTSPFQTSTSHFNRTVISTSTPGPTPLLSAMSRAVKTNCLTELGDTVLCYHCGNTINVQHCRLAKYRTQLGEGRAAAGKTLQETGRTMFDLEKLADTGKVKESIFSLECDDWDKSQTVVETQDFLTGLESLPSKKDPTIRSGEKTKSTPPNSKNGIDSTKTKDPTPTNNQKLKKDTHTALQDSNVVSASEDLMSLFRPCLCSEPDDKSLWTELDTLDVQEMLQLLETSTDDQSHDEVETHEDTNKDSVDEGHQKTDVVDATDDKNQNQESASSKVEPNSPPPSLPTRILRPRKTGNKPKQAAPSRKVN